VILAPAARSAPVRDHRPLLRVWRLDADGSLAAPAWPGALSAPTRNGDTWTAGKHTLCGQTHEGGKAGCLCGLYATEHPEFLHEYFDANDASLIASTIEPRGPVYYGVVRQEVRMRSLRVLRTFPLRDLSVGVQ